MHGEEHAQATFATGCGPLVYWKCTVLSGPKANARKPAKPAVEATRVEEKKAEAPAAPAQPRVATPEEVARAETAEKALSKAKQKMDELEAEVKKARGRSETDRRVFLVQKSEADVAKDKFRALEARHNAQSLERVELRKALFVLEKEMKALRPTAEPKPGEPKPAAAAVEATPAAPASANGASEAAPTPVAPAEAPAAEVKEAEQAKA
jgi:chromosome segregation ATPase